MNFWQYKMMCYFVTVVTHAFTSLTHRLRPPIRSRLIEVLGTVYGRDYAPRCPFRLKPKANWLLHAFHMRNS